MNVPARAEFVENAQSATLLDATFNEYGRHWIKDEDPTVAALASLHNDGEVALFALVAISPRQDEWPSAPIEQQFPNRGAVC